MSDNYTLQLRHIAEDKSFATRDEVLEYIDGQLKYGGATISPYEIILFFYGEETDKNTMIMVGLPEGTTQNGQSYFLIDTADLKAQLEEEISANEDILEGLQTSIDNEVTAREEADEALQSTIDGETAIREEADEELQSNIDAEAAARENADNGLQANIDTEATARENADNDLQANIDTESENRINADDELQSSINTNQSDIASIIEACGLIYNEKATEGRVTYKPDVRDDIICDAESVAEAIEKISKFAIQMSQDLTFSVTNTKTVNLSLSDDNDGEKVLSADVNIALSGGLSTKSYDNNIIGQTSDGLYASASIEPSATNPNVLVFKTSGYVNDEFKVDANEMEVTLTPYKGDSGNKTGIEVTVDTDTIGAKLNLASDKTNILKLEDGEYIVDGRAKNITYVNSSAGLSANTVKSALDTLFDEVGTPVKNTEYNNSDTIAFTSGNDANGCRTLTADVKLSSDESVIVSNGGLSVALEITVDTKLNTLTAKLGNNEQTVKLPGISIISSVEYVTPNVVITFADGSVLNIPMNDLLTPYSFEDDTTGPIHFDVDSSTIGKYVVSANIRLRSTDNLIGIENGYLYVSKDAITEAVDSNFADTTNQLSTLASDIEAVKDNLATEISDREKADIQIQSAIDSEVALRTSEIARVEALVTGEDTSISELKEKVSAIETKNVEQDTAITAVQTSVETEVAARTSEIARVEALITGEDTSIAELVAKVSDIETKNTEQDTAITAVQTSVDAEVAERKSEIARVEALATSHDTEIVDIKTEITDIESKNVEQDTAITAVQTSVDTEVAARTSEVARVEAMVDTNTANIATVTANVTDLQNYNVEQDKTIATVQNDIEKEITARENADTVLTNALETEVTRATEVESELSDKINSISSNVDTIAPEVEAYTDEKVEAETAAREAADDVLQAAIDTKVGNVVLTKEDGSDLVYHLTVDENVYTINIPEDQFLKSVDYESGDHRLKFIFHTTNGEEIVYVDVADLVDTYTAGTGLTMTDNEFSVALNEDSEPYIKVTSEGISIIGINDALANVKSEIEATVDAITPEVEAYTDEKVAAEASAREAADDALQAAIDTKVGSVVLTNGDTDHVYHLTVDGQEYLITIPDNQYLKSAEYDNGNHELSFSFHTPDGDTTTKISLAELVDDYTAGNGLTMTDHEFSVRLNEDSESYIKVTSEGISIIGVDEALSSLKADVEGTMETILPEAKAYTDEKVEAETTARENAVSELTDTVANEVTRATGVEDELSAKIDEVSKSVETASTNATTYTDEKMAIEVAAREEADNALQVSIDGKIGTVTLDSEEGNSLVYHLVVDDHIVSTLNIPKDQFLESVEYESDAHRLKFKFQTTNGTEDVYVDLVELVDVYTAGNGIRATETDKGVEFSIRLNEDSEPYIKVTEEGIAIIGVDDAIAAIKKDVDDVLEDLTKDDTLYNKELETMISDEIVRAKASEILLQANIDNEANRALAAEEELSNAINAIVSAGTSAVALSEEATHITLETTVSEEGDVVTTYTIGENDIASASDLADEITNREEAVSSLETSLKEYVDKAVSDEKERSEGDNSDLQGAIDALTETVNQNTEDIKTLSDKVDDILSTIESIKETLESLIDFGEYSNE